MNEHQEHKANRHSTGTADEMRYSTAQDGTIWDLPLGNAGEIEVAPRRRGFRMSDLTENTRIAIKVGSIFGVALVLMTVGMWIGSLNKERIDNTASIVSLDRRVTNLEEHFASVDKTLALIQQGQTEQKEPINTLTRQSQYSLELLRDLETALAKQGISTEKHGP